jgi:hypothetical protein
MIRLLCLAEKRTDSRLNLSAGKPSQGAVRRRSGAKRARRAVFMDAESSLS